MNEKERTVLSRELQQAAERIIQLVKENAELHAAIKQAHEHNDKVQTEWFKIRKDKARLDWLLENAVIENYTTWHLDDYIKLLTRDDIDAAMKGTE